MQAVAGPANASAARAGVAEAGRELGVSVEKDELHNSRDGLAAGSPRVVEMGDSSSQRNPRKCLSNWSDVGEPANGRPACSLALSPAHLLREGFPALLAATRPLAKVWRTTLPC